MKPPCTDNDTDDAVHRHRDLLALNRLNSHQVHAVCAAARQGCRLRPGRPWRACRWESGCYLVLIHLRTNLTIRALAVLSARSQSTVDGVLRHLVQRTVPATT